MKKAKILLILTALTLALGSLAGCGGSEASPDSETSTSSAEALEGENAKNVDLNRPGEVRDITPAELIAEMKTGWNLGNSFDADSAEGLDAETSWDNPKTTKAMIDEVSARGFDTIRIPVTWGGHMGEAPEYAVDDEWMDRVQEVVNYAVDNDMFVILDSHHEEDWRIPDYEHIDAVSEKVYALWVQIAQRFKDYGDHLIFDGLNEPRVVGGANEWNGGTDEGRRCLDRLNQTFVDAVRSTGGNNEKRLLLVTTFASSSAKQAINDVAVPEDDHIAFSIHAYTPYAFTYSPKEDWELFEWDGSHESDIDNMFYDLKEAFLDKGIPVIITEYGAVNKFGNDDEVAKWVTYYLSTAKSLGIPCVWWDNGYYISGNELFGIFNRDECSWYTETVVNAITAVYE
ncbi:glycoside hydrolase family 5 protein [Ruminococcus sp. Marseille-P6503]|uniref:glycoside hydrolase family 5 protein n=1 Tax=Ruminococcus sp. Marseille-P6503 TaxID=2364796 RepID=UPI001FAAB936|nr:glycoside hydrolase family 5 protein [Ruminococcus sp. Marseille-P6503]